MQAQSDIFNDLKGFIDFGDEDVANLQAVAPLFAAHGGGLTDRFYDKLAGVPSTAALIEGRVDALKKTHARWMGELFAGDYGEGYLQSRWKIGLVHVKVGVPPQYVEAVVSFLRAESEYLLQRELGDSALVAKRHASILKILDIDLMIINLAYAAERVDRLCKFTGMSKKLIERCIEKG
ncbi:MAG: hypothetical protein KC420_10075 [Myxococcales bacterium]|nr:hypothetical protein [Myxococcales bacterium]MCB9568212.1 hypothetical protein [Myxococcales bacterium]MCB9705434.1 hypothetical protein [Myxococcales bacterium]